MLCKCFLKKKKSDEWGVSWNKGDIVFDMSNYLLNDSPKIQVIDIDMNLNPETLDKIPIHIFSDSDIAGILVDAIETHEESGLFETTVSFTQEHASSGNQLFVMSGDGIYAQYDDYTLLAPSGINDDLEIIAEFTIFTDFPIPVIVEQEISSSITSTGVDTDDLDPPLKQIKNDVALIDVRCNEGKSPAYKHNRMSVACVSEETLNELWSRGWTTMRFYTEENTSPHALCNNYEGKWHPEYEGCRDVTALQCSLMGGKFVGGLKICYDEICSVDKTYILCVTNLDLISEEKENEN